MVRCVWLLLVSALRVLPRLSNPSAVILRALNPTLPSMTQKFNPILPMITNANGYVQIATLLQLAQNTSYRLSVSYVAR